MHKFLFVWSGSAWMKIYTHFLWKWCSSLSLWNCFDKTTWKEIRCQSILPDQVPVQPTELIRSLSWIKRNNLGEHHANKMWDWILKLSYAPDVLVCVRHCLNIVVAAEFADQEIFQSLPRHFFGGNVDRQFSHEIGKHCLLVLWDLVRQCVIIKWRKICLFVK